MTESELHALVDRHATALRAGDHRARAEALWGLIALGAGAHGWCEQALESTDTDTVEDAGGVLAQIGVPAALEPRVRQRIRELPDGQARDSLVAALPCSSPREPAGPGLRRAELHEIWFVEGAFEEISAAYRAWERHPDDRFSDHVGSLDALLDLLGLPVKPSWKTLLVETSSDWTALFQQSGSGADSTPHLARVLGIRALRTRYVPARDVAFWLFDGARDDVPLHQIRTIQATRSDSGWAWHLSGEPQPFEEPERYGERTVARRFDHALLGAYCRALGIRRDDAGFYGPRALLYEQGWHAAATQARPER